MNDSEVRQIVYTSNVGIVLLNSNNQIFLGERMLGGWGMPQGNVECGESVETTARRELYEETGLRNLSNLVILPGNFSYQIPNTHSGKMQKWVRAKWCGEEEINLTAGPYQEFRDYRWTSAEAALQECVYFKREIYCKVLRAAGIVTDESGE